MKAFPVDSSRHAYYHKPCADPLCAEPMQIGDVAMVEVGPNPTAVVHREMVWHRRCTAAALSVAPLERTDLSERLGVIKACIHATGMNPVELALGAFEDDEATV